MRTLARSISGLELPVEKDSRHPLRIRGEASGWNGSLRFASSSTSSAPKRTFQSLKPRSVDRIEPATFR